MAILLASNIFIGVKVLPGPGCSDSEMIAGNRSSNWVDALRQCALGAHLQC